MAKKSLSTLPLACFSESSEVRYLHLGTPWIQGAMRLDDPLALELEYVQRMMAWLLFLEPAEVARCQAMQLGLGAAALTKFCRKKLRMKTRAVELNPHVVVACRLWFKLPSDDERLSVLLADASELVADARWHGQIDALQVDLYDHEAAAPVLDSEAFYAGCRALLSERGCMTVNLFGRASSYERSLAKITAVFGEDAIWAFKPTREGNTVVLAQRTPQRPPRAVLAQRAETIQTRWDLPAAKWLRVFRPTGAKA